MSENFILRKDESGNTVVVQTIVTENSIPLGADELRRQIKEHSDIVCHLQRQLQAVEKFEASNKVEDSAILPADIKNPIIDADALAKVASVQDTES